MAHSSFPTPCPHLPLVAPSTPRFPGYPSAPPLPQFPPKPPIPPHPPPPPAPCSLALARAFSNWGSPAQNSRPCPASQSEWGPCSGPPQGPPPPQTGPAHVPHPSQNSPKTAFSTPLHWHPVDRAWHCPQMSPSPRVGAAGSPQGRPCTLLPIQPMRGQCTLLPVGVLAAGSGGLHGAQGPPLPPPWLRPHTHPRAPGVHREQLHGGDGGG